jgi:alcohol dehydrogenase (cytochrome c)
MMRKSALALLVAILAPLGAHAQTAQDLINSAKNTENVLTYGMGYDLQRYSTLLQIDASNVQHLVPVWNYSLNDNRGEESQPLVIDGVMYLTTHDATMAIDALTGRQIWKSKVEYPPAAPRVACCGIVNRGLAAYDGKLFRTTLDAHVVAYDMKSGKRLWKSKAIDFKTGYSMTVAPLVADGVVITGISGGEYGIRGFLDGWDPRTGKHLWRRYTVPSPRAKGGDTWPGDTWKHGGGATWLTGSYDPELDLVYWGVGNPGSWNALVRKGDNLYTNSVIAIRPKTGKIVWHYQFTPNDAFDYDGVNELILADLKVNGEERKVLMQANRNGFFYVIDRANGKLLAANPFVKVTWADGVDMTTGRPIKSAITKEMYAGKQVEVWPSAFGGKNWMPMSYNPQTGLAYANTLNFGWTYQAQVPKYRAGVFYFGAKFAWAYPKGPRGYLKAIDPMSGKAKWEVESDLPNFSGTLSTAGGLVFTGTETGAFKAYDAETGKELWQFQTGSGIVGQPITWSRDGRQYVTVTSGIGGVYALFSGDERLAQIPPGGSLWTFALPRR